MSYILSLQYPEVNYIIFATQTVHAGVMQFWYILNNEPAICKAYTECSIVDTKCARTNANNIIEFGMSERSSDSKEETFLYRSQTTS